MTRVDYQLLIDLSNELHETAKNWMKKEKKQNSNDSCFTLLIIAK